MAPSPLIAPLALTVFVWVLLMKRDGLGTC